MSAERCSLAWRAAALEDGRLEGADRSAFEHHALRCADCRAEAKALAALYRRVRGDLPDVSLTELEHARRRGMLLEKANERFVRAPSGMARSRAAQLLACAIAVVAIGCTLVLTRSRRSAAPATSEARAERAPPFVLEDGSRAIWRARTDGAATRIEVADGVAVLRVDECTGAQKLGVSLPDGEIEASGARFRVSVAMGQTRSVDVTEGQVRLRRPDQPDMTLHGGEGWSKAGPVVVALPEPPTESPATGAVPLHSGGRPIAVRGSSSQTHTSHPSPRPSSVGGAVPSRHAGEEFDAAIGHFVAGSYERADSELLEFMRTFPDDSRCEDASFLSTVARWRMGDRAGARARARRYLAVYPNGLRRPEAQHIADDTR